MKIIKTNSPYDWGDPWNDLGNGPNWANGPLIGMDTETTDKYPQTARIVTSAVVMDNSPGNEITDWTWIANPECHIELEATAVHGFNDEYVQKHGRDTASVIREMLSIMSALWRKYQCPMVMVNSPFDLTIIRQEMIRLELGRIEDIELPPIIDTLTIDRKLDPFRRGKRSLTATSAAYGIPIVGAHTAIGDIQCSIKLARAMATRYPQFATCDMQHLQKLQSLAHKEWCENYEQYRRLEHPDFTIASHGWPYQVYEDK
jgi:DNA polymerase III subunit epsilon